MGDNCDVKMSDGVLTGASLCASCTPPGTMPIIRRSGEQPVVTMMVMVMVMCIS